MIRRCLVIVGVQFCFLSSIAAAETNWPGFLGAGATGVQVERLPTSWTMPERQRWSAVLPGHGQSSPVVWNDRLFVTSVEGPMKDTYHVVCLNARDGKELWRRQLTNSVPVESSFSMSRAAPTPVVDSERVVAQFESGDCAAYTHSGELLWQRNLAADYGPLVAEFGLGASPCQTDKLVFVLLEHDGPSCLVALDKQTGETAWKAERSPRQSWSSPAIIQVDGEPQVVVSSLGSVDGYDPRSGTLLWSFTDVGGNTGVTPIDCGAGQFLIGASGGRQGEHGEAAKRSNALLEVVRSGDGYSVTRKWIAEGASPSWASPIVHQGLAYWMNRGGVILCFDATTGEQVYTKRTKQSCWATPLAANDRIFWFGKDGLCTVIATGREFKILAENPLWADTSLVEEEVFAKEETAPERQAASAAFGAPIVYGYAVAGDRLFIRIGNQIFCIGE